MKVKLNLHCRFPFELCSMPSNKHCNSIDNLSCHSSGILEGLFRAYGSSGEEDRWELWKELGGHKGFVGGPLVHSLSQRNFRRISMARRNSCMWPDTSYAKKREKQLIIFLFIIMQTNTLRPCSVMFRCFHYQCRSHLSVSMIASYGNIRGGKCGAQQLGFYFGASGRRQKRLFKEELLQLWRPVFHVFNLVVQGLSSGGHLSIIDFIDRVGSALILLVGFLVSFFISLLKAGLCTFLCNRVCPSIVLNIFSY